jgi:anti-anti-sigma factor
MPTPPKSPLAKTITRGVLVLTILEPQLHGDRQVNVFRHELDQAVADSGTPEVVLDFRNVKSLSSAAFRPLLTLRRNLEALGGHLTLCHLAPVVAEAFQATRVIGGGRTSAAAFEVQPTLAAALAARGRADDEEAPPPHPGRPH